MGDLASIVKAYDIRGVVPDQLDEGVAEAIGAAFAALTGAGTILTVHDTPDVVRLDDAREITHCRTRLP